MLEQPGGVAYLVIDEITRTERVLRPFAAGLAGGIDKMAEAGERGGRYACASDTAALLDVLAGWGVDRDAAGVALASATDVLRKPPYAVLEVMVGVTYTYGGLRADATGAVVDAKGQAVGGLLTCGADRGAISGRTYLGGMAHALVSASVAARTASKQN